MALKEENIQNIKIDNSNEITKQLSKTEFKIEDNWIPDRAKKGYHEQ